MEYLVFADEMKYYDQQTIEEKKIPSMVLMERAALAVVEVMEERDLKKDKILVVCGSGNNGGDGFAIARLLYLKGYHVDVTFLGVLSHCTKECYLQQEILRNFGFKYNSNIPDKEYTVIVDAIFGIGLARSIEGSYEEVIRTLNSLQAYKVAVDIPSGISTDSGKVMGVAFQADVTVTFAFRKVGLVLYPGASYAGRVVVKDIGIIKQEWTRHYPSICSYQKTDLSELPPRKPYSNKGTYGKVLLIAGSDQISGAAYLSGKAAYRIGAGYVKIFTPKENRVILQSQLPEALLSVYEANEFEKELKVALSWADTVAIGPGIGENKNAEKILRYVLSECQKPLLIDADGINILARHMEDRSHYQGNLILTPHVKEFSRLTKKELRVLTEDLVKEAYEFAKQNQLICVAKDARTVVTDGVQNIYLNQSGNSGMATAGSGDVLTGIIAGLLAQGMAPFLAASLGVYMHGLAGDAAKERIGEYAMMADDIIDHISDITHYIS